MKPLRFFEVSVTFYQLDVRGSVHHSIIPYRKSQQNSTVYQTFVIPYVE